jgi:hypothetical protein
MNLGFNSVSNWATFITVFIGTAFLLLFLIGQTFITVFGTAFYYCY